MSLNLSDLGNIKLSLGGLDMTPHICSTSFDVTQEFIDVTAFGSTWRELRTTGTYSATVTINLVWHDDMLWRFEE